MGILILGPPHTFDPPVIPIGGVAYMVGEIVLKSKQSTVEKEKIRRKFIKNRRRRYF